MTLTLENFDHCCRCCLSTIPPLHPLFGLSLNNLLTDITSLEINKDDGYPQQVCRRCCSKIASTSAFKSLVLKNYQILKKLAKESVTEEIDLKPDVELQSNFENNISNVPGNCVEVAQNSIAYENGKNIIVKKPENNSFKNKNDGVLSEDMIKSISNVKDTEKSVRISTSVDDGGQEVNEDDRVKKDKNNSFKDKNVGVLGENMLKSIGNVKDTEKSGQISTSVDERLHTCIEGDSQEDNEDDIDDTFVASSDGSQDNTVVTLKCRFCKMECKNRIDLKVHLKIHDETCKVCDKRISRCNRDRHMRTHEAKHLRCEECGKEFSDPSYFRQHLKKHRNEPPAARKDCLCSYCGRKYRWKSSLYRHLHIHVGNSHDCDICGRKFTNPYYLKIHLVQHMGPENKPFKCEQCDAKFTRDASLVQHRRTVHSTGPRQRWPCTYCEKAFLHKVTRARHESLQHWAEPKIYKCAQCGKKFKSRRSRGLHLRIHKTSQKHVEGNSLQDGEGVQVKSEGIEKITVVRVEEYEVSSTVLQFPDTK